MPTAHDVAKYFLSLTDEQSGDLISNLKLQKLLYYAQGFSLALEGAPLFADRIKAWEHGPVVPDVWHAYREAGNGAIPAPDGVDVRAPFTAEQIELLDEVYSTYGQFSAWKLRNLTHEEAPWRNTARNAEISQQSMREYFTTQVN